MAMARRLGASGPPAVPTGVLAIRDVPFVMRQDRPLQLDIYRPERPKRDALPVVLYVFGGGWMSGDRNQVEALRLLRFVEHDYAVVTADYRYSTDARFPAQIRDVKAAIRWIRANAIDQGFDPERVAILGPSAGGHLAALAGTAADIPALEGDLADWTPRERLLSTRVGAVVDFFGPTDLSVYEAQHRAGGLGNSDRLWFLDLLVGGPVEEAKDLVQMANPIRYVDPGDPPFLIIHGDADPIVPLEQSRLLTSALARAGVEATLRIVDGGNHGRSAEFASDALFAEILAFLDDSLDIEHGSQSSRVAVPARQISNPNARSRP